MYVYIYISALLQYKLYPHYIPLLNPAIQKAPLDGDTGDAALYRIGDIPHHMIILLVMPHISRYKNHIYMCIYIYMYIYIYVYIYSTPNNIK